MIAAVIGNVYLTAPVPAATSASSLYARIGRHGARSMLVVSLAIWRARVAGAGLVLDLDLDLDLDLARLAVSRRPPIDERSGSTRAKPPFSVLGWAADDRCFTSSPSCRAACVALGLMLHCSPAAVWGARGVAAGLVAVFAYDRVRMPLVWRVDVLETTSADRQGVAQGSTVDE